MAELLFDEKGFLIPHQAIPTDLEAVRSNFVFNERREQIFDAYLQFMEALRGTLPPRASVIQWLDGSFITKAPWPKDIDLISFIDYNAFLAHESRVRALKHRWPRGDWYFLSQYPPGHPNEKYTTFEQVEWLHLFTKDHDRNRKGFVQLTLST